MTFMISISSFYYNKIVYKQQLKIKCVIYTQFNDNQLITNNYFKLMPQSLVKTTN